MAFKIRTKGVKLLNVRERILTIRLLEQVVRHPMYAAGLGIECVPEMDGTDDSGEPP